MKKSIVLNVSLLITVLIVLVSCATQPTINGLWQSTTEIGTIEFKATGELVIVDNMSATVTGYYRVEEDNLITFELTASDILRDSIQASSKTVIIAKIIKLNDDELQLHLIGDDEDVEVENYRRVR